MVRSKSSSPCCMVQVLARSTHMQLWAGLKFRRRYLTGHHQLHVASGLRPCTGHKSTRMPDESTMTPALYKVVICPAGSRAITPGQVLNASCVSLILYLNHAGSHQYPRRKLSISNMEVASILENVFSLSCYTAEYDPHFIMRNLAYPCFIFKHDIFIKK